MQTKLSNISAGRRLSLTATLALALMVVLTGACGKGGSTGGALSPTDTLKAYYDAANKKDVASIKKYLSKGTITIMEVGAKAMGKNLDDALKEEAATSKAAQTTPKFSNEKISGDTATVDVSAEGQTISMPLVKEGGEWKIAMDKLLQNMGAPTMPSTTSATPAATPASTPAEDDEDHENSNH